MKIIFHIGMPKTGTTSLQSYLFSNKESLLSQQIVYEPEIFCSSGAHHYFASNFWTNPDETIKTLINRLTLHKNCKYYLISSEVLISWPQNFVQLLYKHLQEFDIEVVLYIRRQDDLIESLYKQSIKMGEKRTIQELIERFNPSYEDIVTKWHRNERYTIHVIKYTPSKTIETFSNLYDISIDSKYDTNCKRNISPSTNHIELLELILKNTDVKFSRLEAINFLQGLNAPKSYRIVSLSERKAIMDHYKDSNMAISTQFFDGKPLFAPSAETETDYIGYPSLTPDEIVKILEKYLLYCLRSNKHIDNLIKSISKNGDFDEKFYKEKYLCGRAELFKPIEHFARFGMYKNFKPNRYFDMEKIYSLYPELQNTGIPPYIIYSILRIIGKEKFCPNDLQ